MNRTEGRTYNGAAATGIKASDLKRMVFPPIKYIVPGYIAEGLTLLAGKPKQGKSWLCLDIAISVAGGRRVLGDVECEQGDVLYAALEDNPRRLQTRIARILPWGEWPDRLELQCEWPRLDQGGVKKIREWIERAEAPRLVVVDTLAKVRGARSSDSVYEADYAALEDLHRLARDKCVAIVLVHHVRKMDADDPLDTVSGSTGMTGAPDAIMVIARDGQGVTFHGRGRDIEEFAVAAKFDRNSCRWTVQGPAAEVRRSDERSTILEALREAEEPMSPAEIADATDMASGNVRRLLGKMVRDGEVEKAKRGRYSAPEPPGNIGNKVTGEEKEVPEQDLSAAADVTGTESTGNIEPTGHKITSEGCAYCGLPDSPAAPLREAYVAAGFHWLHDDCIEPWQDGGADKLKEGADDD